MPTYVYEVVLPEGQGGEQFELIQPISEPPLTEHPQTGEPVRRVIQPVFVGGQWSDSSMRRRFSSWVRPERISLPMTSMQAVTVRGDLSGMAEDHSRTPVLVEGRAANYLVPPAGPMANP